MSANPNLPVQEPQNQPAPPTNQPNPQNTNNTVIETMRTNLELAQNEAKEAKERLAKLENERLTDSEKLQREKDNLLTENQRLTAELAKIPQLEEQIAKFNTYLTNRYETELAKVEDATQKEQIKTITFIDSDPIASLDKLTAQFGLLGLNQPVVAGNVTNPVNPTPPAGTPGQVDPKKVNWGQALKSVDQLKKEAQK